MYVPHIGSGGDYVWVQKHRCYIHDGGGEVQHMASLPSPGVCHPEEYVEIPRHF